MSQIDYRFMRLKVEFYHWWNSRGSSNDNDHHMLTRRPRGLPLISLRNAEYVKYYMKMGFDEARLHQIGRAEQSIIKQVHDSLAIRLHLSNLSRSVRRVIAEPNYERVPLGLPMREHESFIENYRIQIVNDDETNVDMTLISTQDQQNRSIEEVSLERESRPQSSLASSIEEELNPHHEFNAYESELEESGTEGKQQPFLYKSFVEETEEIKSTKKKSGISKLLKMKPKRKKFIRTPPTEDSALFSGLDPSATAMIEETKLVTKPYKKVFVLSPTKSPPYNSFLPVTEQSNSAFWPASQEQGSEVEIVPSRDADSNYSSNIAHYLFRLKKLKRTVSRGHSSDQRFQNRFVASETLTTASGENYTTDQMLDRKPSIYKTVINYVSLNAALKASGGNEIKVDKKVNSGFTNVNDYSSVFGKENSSQINVPKANQSFDSCVNETILIEKKPVDGSSAPLSIVLQSPNTGNFYDRHNEEDNDDTSTYGYDSNLISTYLASDGSQSNEPSPLLVIPRKKIDVVKGVRR
ncbi:hypothetical protein CANARDRAFT_8888 [[Candida] arabinofermentans NRRL YB-2248]|uniref:Uncharacterized protein n=1 Tax=[Candida] arabinofermentans NRRL YB-2248 TaxID=983967 RepID=A0A1E4SXH8_9ASCO|nr:hypothetical protein CANARDRAFT_8888 [[Candida] arabinofermentans NRRL YB-2248]